MRSGQHSGLGEENVYQKVCDGKVLRIMHSSLPIHSNWFRLDNILK